MPGELLRTLTPPFTLSLGRSRKESLSQTSKMAQSTKQSQRQSQLHLIKESDEVYEMDIQKSPYSLRPWLNYINFKRQNGTPLEQCFVMERACNALPRSYKIWKVYLELRVNHLKGKVPARFVGEFTKVNNLFERALVLLNKMPVIWEMYLSFLCLQPQITNTRLTFDRALQALPLTQHNRIWALYKPFANATGGVTAVKIWQRYVKLHPEDMEDYIFLLVREEYYTEAVQRYIDILNDRDFRSKEGKGPFDLWKDMLDVLVQNARLIPNPVPLTSGSSVSVEKIIKTAIERYPDQTGDLRVGLARYYIKAKRNERARDVFEDGITSVGTIRDFSVIFDVYSGAEEDAIGKRMDELAALKEKGIANEDLETDLNIRMMRFEHLIDRRPFLINDVYLRQNPHNVTEWKKRVALWGDNKKMIVETYTKAIAAINPKRATGKLESLWVDYAKFYEKGRDIRTARIIFDKAVKVPFKSVSELSDVWTEWAEMEMRAEGDANTNAETAIQRLATATMGPKRSNVDYFDETLTPQQRVHKSWKLWSFYADLVEAFHPLSEVRKVYDRIFELRIATPLTVVNYANVLEEAGYHEDSFRIYERGLELFSYPVAFELWNNYLQKAVDRHIGIERLRDLFEQALEGVPPKFAKPIYRMYGALEEDRGLARHAMRIYERATRAVAETDKLEMFEFYIMKSTSNFGITSTRKIYEEAITALPDREASGMCMKFAEVERRMGEIDRARAVWGHGSQFCDPRMNPQYWQGWEKFEVQHGNEDTYKEMLRIKRSVTAEYKYEPPLLLAPYSPYLFCASPSPSPFLRCVRCFSFSTQFPG